MCCFIYFGNHIAYFGDHIAYISAVRKASRLCFMRVTSLCSLHHVYARVRTTGWEEFSPDGQVPTPNTQNVLVKSTCF